ncbi:490_t:CDS:1, partial [Funneliformis caledonium]
IGLQYLHPGGVPAHSKQLNLQEPQIAVHTLLHSPVHDWTEVQ